LPVLNICIIAVKPVCVKAAIADEAVAMWLTEE